MTREIKFRGKRVDNGEWGKRVDYGELLWYDQIKKELVVGKIVDITGIRFGKLVVLNHCYKRNRSAWNCICDCGKQSVIITGDLKSGKVNSCGCAKYNALIKRNTIHGMSRTRLYRIWRGMITRCDNASCKSFPNYGARGVFVCDEWRHDFAEFYRWSMLNGYKDNLTIDRMNSACGYSESNCRWIEKAMQSENRRARSVYPNRDCFGKFCVSHTQKEVNL